MLELMYETFVAAGKWPLFQYVSALWDEVDVEARDVYLDLAEQDLVRPAMTRSHDFQLRQETVVGLSPQGLMHMGPAGDDLGRFVATVRYAAKTVRENSGRRLRSSSGVSQSRAARSIYTSDSSREIPRWPVWALS
jgi:hypothetical protein